MVNLLQYIVSGLQMGSIFALIALGFVLVYKCSKILNLAQGGFVILGAYVCMSFAVDLGLPFWLSFVLTMVVAFLLGWGLERFPLRPTMGQSGEALFMLSLGLYIFIVGITYLVWGGLATTYPQIFPSEAIMIGDIAVTYQYLCSTVICLSLLVIFYVFFRFTKTGLSMRSVAESHRIAQSMGVNVNRVIAMSWGIAAVVGVVSGVMLGAATSVDYGLAELGLSGLAVALFGGLESVGGVIIAGLLMGILQSLVGAYISFELSTVVPFIIVVLVLLFRPYGLFGLERVERV